MVKMGKFKIIFELFWSQWIQSVLERISNQIIRNTFLAKNCEKMAEFKICQ